MRFHTIDLCPVPESIAPAVREVKADTGATLTSCYRGDDPNGVRILHRWGKQNQRELYDGFRRGLPGYNPANPPGSSTHECRSDGVAYRWWPRFLRIPSWAVGQDWTNGVVASAVVRMYVRHGFVAAITYPGNSRELHHVNLRKKPRISKWARRPLKRGSQGKRVGRVRWILEHVHDPDTHKPYLGRQPGLTRRLRRHFGVQLEDAVEAFQRDHGQHDDGVVGPQTIHQLRVSYRHWKQKEGK